jgi:hypothetical protein
MRLWKEHLDPEKHWDYMSMSQIGGMRPKPPLDNLIVQWVYFVNVCSFTFQFHSIEQIRECLDYFSQKPRPPSRMPLDPPEHDLQRWYERLPMWLFEEPKRRKVVKALEKALVEFAN